MKRILIAAAALTIAFMPAAFAQLGGDSSTNITNTNTSVGATTPASINAGDGAAGASAITNTSLYGTGGIDSPVPTGPGGDHHLSAVSTQDLSGSVGSPAH
jgi:hypothetical protein